MNFTDKALAKSAEFFLSVKKHGDPELTKKRIKICENGPCIFFDPHRRVCTLCGCFVDVKAKLEKNISIRAFKGKEVVELTHCPYGKWDDKELANEYRKIYDLALIP